MKTVVLIGDSIRMGYQDVVRRELAGRAEIWSPEQNGGTSQNILAHLDEWCFSRDAGVVHINCGLHDLKKEFGQDRAAIPLAQYETNVRTILTRLQAETGASVVWATTTPVNQAWHHANKSFDRFEADVIAYNATAERVARDLDIPVNDLFAVVQQEGRDGILRPDGVHFSPAGYEILGKRVAGFVAGLLD
jgi:lysophospholipase L1-like esterase